MLRQPYAWETATAMARAEERVDAVGEEPDARFSMANERTFLAWIRTAIALLVAGLAVAEFFESVSEAARLAIALPLVLLGAIVAFVSFGAWEDKERAMRLGEPLPRSSTPRLVAFAVGAVAVVAAVLAVIDA
jgi:putative membrane protein